MHVQGPLWKPVIHTLTIGLLSFPFIVEKGYSFVLKAQRRHESQAGEDLKEQWFRAARHRHFFFLFNSVFLLFHAHQ